MRLLLLVITLLMPLQATADKLGACDKALGACEALVKAQDADIERLKGNVKALSTKLEEESKPSIPPWIWILLGAGAGAAVGGALHK